VFHRDSHRDPVSAIPLALLSALCRNPLGSGHHRGFLILAAERDGLFVSRALPLMNRKMEHWRDARSSLNPASPVRVKVSDRCEEEILKVTDAIIRWQVSRSRIILPQRPCTLLGYAEEERK